VFATERCPLGTRAEDRNDARPEDATAEPQPRAESALGLSHERPLPLGLEVVTRPLRKQENRATARFLKPSAGLEPATPSLPWKCSTN
jgi:hypothetical protein